MTEKGLGLTSTQALSLEQRHLCLGISTDTMEKLPIHSGDAPDGPDPNGTSSRSRRDRFIPPHRIVIAAGFLICWFLVIKLSHTTYLSHGCGSHHAPGYPVSDVSNGFTPDTPDQTWKDNKQPQADPEPLHVTSLADTKIPLEAHIMSKCPDAQACLQKLVLPAMEQISDKVDFRLSFIAR
jgi:hypothetical protein